MATDHFDLNDCSPTAPADRSHRHRTNPRDRADCRRTAPPVRQRKTDRRSAGICKTDRRSAGICKTDRRSAGICKTDRRSAGICKTDRRSAGICKTDRRSAGICKTDRRSAGICKTDRRSGRATLSLAVGLILLVVGGPAIAGHPNVLFIAVDDLRPELGCYGSPIAVTPNLDALAADGLLFNRAYCQQAICRPSRASLMTGARPDTTGLYHNYVALRELQPDILTLPEHFIANGYEAAYCGKIFHNGDTDDGRSWSRDPVRKIAGVKKPIGGYALPENNAIRAENLKKMVAKYGEAARRGLGSGPAYESADVPDTAYVDGYNTQLAIATMKEMVAAGDKPFFLGMGYKLPHLNWCSPKRYWDLYDPQKIPMASESNAPKDGAAMGLHASFELRTRFGIPKSGPLGPELSRTLKHAYLASRQLRRRARSV